MILDKLKTIEDSEFLFDFLQIMKTSEYKKNDLIHEEGTTCNHLFFIEKGIARVFYYKDGKEVTSHFAVENEATTAIDSFIQRKKSRYNIESLEDTRILSISHNDLQKLFNEKPRYEKYSRLFLEQIYIDLAERIEDLLFHNAKERYEKLFNEKPDLFQRVNLGHIASYIGISQETLSRIRNQV